MRTNIWQKGAESAFAVWVRGHADHSEGPTVEVLGAGKNDGFILWNALLYMNVVQVGLPLDIPTCEPA